jgi:NAD(P)-dependent dehydrogenase (short-subunit alcohol dehydrogenase family)
MRIQSLRDKKCFITGAASGIGRATAIAAGQQGAQLFLTDINAQALTEVAAGIRDSGGNVGLARALDITDFEAVKVLARDIEKAHGSMDVLMNIAGISIWGSVEQLEHQQWRRVIETNLMGPIHVIECFVPAMIKAGRGGHLVNVSSAAGLFGLPWHAAYSASKFGLRGISEVLRFDLKRHGIGVSLVCPGGVNTGLVNTIEIQGLDSTAKNFVALKRQFQKHAVSPETAAAAIINGIKRGKYMVYTSFDIWIGHWFQRKFSPPYEFVMRILNDRLNAIARPRSVGVISK